MPLTQINEETLKKLENDSHLMYDTYVENFLSQEDNETGRKILLNIQKDLAQLKNAMKPEEKSDPSTVSRLNALESKLTMGIDQLKERQDPTNRINTFITSIESDLKFINDKLENKLLSRDDPSKIEKYNKQLEELKKLDLAQQTTQKIHTLQTEIQHLNKKIADNPLVFNDMPDFGTTSDQPPPPPSNNLRDDEDEDVDEDDSFDDVDEKPLSVPPQDQDPIHHPVPINTNPININPPPVANVSGGNSPDPTPKQIPNKQGRTFIIEKTVLEERTLGTNFYYSTEVVKASDALKIGSFSSFKETGDVDLYEANPNDEIAYEGKVIGKGEIIPCLFAPPGSKPVLEEKTQQNAAAYDNAAENRYGLLKVDHTGKISSTSKNLSEAEKEELAFHQAKMLLDNYQPSKDGKTIFINGRNPEMVKKVYAALLFFKKNVPEFEDIKIQSLVPNTKPSKLPFKSAFNTLIVNQFISKNLNASDKDIKNRYQDKMKNIAHIKNTLATKMDKIDKEYNKLDEENVKLSKELSKKPNVLFKQTPEEREKKKKKIEENFTKMEGIEAEFHRHNSLKGKLIKLKKGEVTISDDNDVKNENNIKP
ncbi:hypothetical protein [Legionella fairfieldensis]|uniref:hypothetical protein n=1 Tax=Legionella fairfieldensis TaxID=45064 RepID=UPI00048DCAB3|nr:hypothetical protein [Legionella fairfieldensis]